MRNEQMIYGPILMDNSFQKIFNFLPRSLLLIFAKQKKSWEFYALSFSQKNTVYT